MHDTLRHIVPLSLLIAAGVGGAVSHAAIKAQHAAQAQPVAATVGRMVKAMSGPVATPPKPVWIWEGKDVDGDGAADFMNPTGKGVRSHDAFGEGEFGASRDGGGRRHEGVDYIARAGQQVKAPMSGYVTKIGYAYAGDRHRFVEISNPALKFEARVFYVDPSVKVGQAVHIGDSIGSMDSLQSRYAGITDHVHLEMYDRGRRIDSEKLIVAELKVPATRG